MANECNSLTSWLLQDSKTFISPKLSTSRTLVTGNSIFASGKVFKNEKIINIPSRFHINFLTILQDLQKYNLHPEEFIVCDNYSKERVTGSDAVCEIYAKLTYRELSSLTSFQIVSLYLVLESQRSDSFWKPFLDILPELEEFKYVPLVWLISGDLKHFNRLPKSSQKHSLKQLHQFEKDYKVVSKLMSDKMGKHQDFLPKESFLRFWLCCNSRCLYMKLPESLQKTNEDNFTMVPYVDFLNHDTEEKCTVKVNLKEFQILSATNYQPDDQILLCYGAHSNEFLLCEYGFMLDRSYNKWNSIDITDEILELIENSEKRKFLKRMNYFGDYHVNKEISFRIEVALLVSQEIEFNASSPPTRLMNFINGFTNGEIYQSKTNKILETIFTKIVDNCEPYIKKSINDYKDKILQRLYEDIEDIALHHLNSL